MARLTYMPLADDGDETRISGVTFKAYEPTEVADDHPLLEKLAGNAWFTTGEGDEARKNLWQRARDGAKAVEAARAADKAANG